MHYISILVGVIIAYQLNRQSLTTIYQKKTTTTRMYVVKLDTHVILLRCNSINICINSTIITTKLITLWATFTHQ